MVFRPAQLWFCLCNPCPLRPLHLVISITIKLYKYSFAYPPLLFPSIQSSFKSSVLLISRTAYALQLHKRERAHFNPLDLDLAAVRFLFFTLTLTFVFRQRLDGWIYLPIQFHPNGFYPLNHSRTLHRIPSILPISRCLSLPPHLSSLILRTEYEDPKRPMTISCYIIFLSPSLFRSTLVGLLVSATSSNLIDHWIRCLKSPQSIDTLFYRFSNLLSFPLISIAYHVNDAPTLFIPNSLTFSDLRSGLGNEHIFPSFDPAVATLYPSSTTYPASSVHA